MSSFENFASSQVTKMFLLGDSGAGKTGALMSLAAAGYNLRILDLDNGVEVMNDYITNPQSIYTKPLTGLWSAEQAKGLLGRIRYETITDPMRNVNGKLIPKSATVWVRAVKLLDNWTKANGASDDFGPISTWTSQDILVIDSLTLLSRAALNFILSLNARLGQQPHQSDWYGGQQLLEGLLTTLYDEGVRCNVILNCHVKLLGDENGPQRGYPETLGKALSPNIGRWVNTCLLARTSGSGNSVKHKILTTSTPQIELKTTAPLRVKPEYDLATGLAEYFQAIRGGTLPIPQDKNK